ncbi:MAG: signal peptidase I [Pseudoflavonifractor sp.]
MKEKLLSAGVNALCAVAILFSLAVGWTAITTERGKAPTLLGNTMLTVLTGSMEPALPERSLILVRETPAEAIEPGDIITFYARIGGYEGVLNTHRVVECTQAEGQLAFVTKGDANATADPSPVLAEDLVGRVVFQSLILGIIVSFLRMPPVFLTLVLVPLLIIIGSSVRRLLRLAKEEISRAEEPDEEDLDGKG